MIRQITINDAFYELEYIMKDVLHWMSPLYDEKIGGFHLAHSSLEDSEEYFCSLWDTRLAVCLLADIGLLSSMPPGMKQKLVNFFQSRQDPTDGYFYDQVRFIEKRFTSRETEASKQVLKLLGAKPLYPIPSDDNIIKTFEQLTSPQLLRQWLEELDWSNPYNTNATINDISPMIDSLSDPLRSELLKTLWNYVDSMQSEETGFWGKASKELSFCYTSGVMKMDVPFRRFHKSFEKADKIFHSSLEVLRTQKSDYFLDYRNIATVFRSIGNCEGVQTTEEEIAEIVMKLVTESRRFLHSDGGFSRFIDKPYYGEERHILSKGLAEGDMNSVANAIQLRAELYTFAGMECPDLPGISNFYLGML